MALAWAGHESPPENTPRPSYYAYAVYARAFGNQLIEASSSDPTVKVYASTFTDSPRLGLVLVNETEQAARVTIAHAGRSAPVLGWVLTGAADRQTMRTR